MIKRILEYDPTTNTSNYDISTRYNNYLPHNFPCRVVKLNVSDWFVSADPLFSSVKTSTAMDLDHHITRCIVDI